MKKYILREFTVDGPGCVPVDMLRYDGCYPATSEDAAEMERRQLRRQGDLPRDTPRRPITLKSAHHSAPTTARWQSFLWNVTEIKA